MRENQLYQIKEETQYLCLHKKTLKFKKKIKQILKKNVFILFINY